VTHFRKVLQHSIL